MDSLGSIFKLTKLEVLKIKLTVVGDITLPAKTVLYSMVEVPSIPTTIGTLTKLRELELGIGEFATVPASVSNLVNLQELSFYRNTTTNHTAIPDFTKLPLLKHLTLQGFNFQTIPSSLMTLTQLESLELSMCNITGEFPLFAPNLKQLNIRRNKITNFPPGAASYWVKMKILQMSHNSLVGQVSDYVFPSITSLTIDQNSIVGTLPPSMAAHVEYFSADKNKISGTIPPEIFSFTASKVTTLSLSYNQLSGTIPWDNSKSNLSILDLSYNQLSGTLGNLTAQSMKELILTSNKLTGTLPGQVSFPFINKIYVNKNLLAGPIPAKWFEVNTLQHFQTLARRLSQMEALDFSGQKIGGGCFSIDLDWKFDHCDLGDARFHCDCPPVTLCGSKPCYTTDDPCSDPELNICSEGAKCINNAYTKWYDCVCEPDYVQVDIYTCVAKNPCVTYGCGAFADCSQLSAPVANPTRVCTCHSGFTSEQDGKPLIGNVTFSGCSVNDTCILPGCGAEHSKCSLVGLARNCTCDPGYRVSASTASSLVLTNKNDVFPGCTLVDMCDHYSGCGDPHSTCVWRYANERQCQCEAGYVPVSSDKGSIVTVVGDDLFEGCKEVMACEIAGCANPDNTTIATCEESIEDKRICHCPFGFTPETIQLSLDQPFTGCIDFPECVWRCDTHSSCSEEAPGERTCTCDKGWSGTATIVGNAPFAGCKDIDECLDENACPEGNQCDNLDGSFTCSCKIGYIRTGDGLECFFVEEGPSLVGPIVGAAVGVVSGLILILLLYWFYWRPRQILKKLPADVRWHFQKYYEGGYKKCDRGESSYYTKLLKVDSDAYKSVMIMWNQFFESKLNPHEIYAIYSPHLVNSFVNHRELLKTRMAGQGNVFNNKKWKLGKEAEAKGAIYSAFEKRLISAYEWNAEEVVPILPAVHATSFEVANSICATGFVALSSLDEGWYGKGIYFSTFANYTLPYLVRYEDPSMLISFLACGNTLPVNQHHQASNSLIGKPIVSGYNSHYIVVKPDGEVPKEATDSRLYDEVVVAQEAQIVPAYVIRLKQSECSALMKSWTRHTVDGGGSIFGLRGRRASVEVAKRKRKKSNLGFGSSVSHVSLDASAGDMYVPLIDMSEG
eukprot:TRINITY_DN14290_c0_g1_i1.p1 TRINITY_DN14290_c0_g1~~TRINITY_DN14290_c0_g1_i1.p1  ORF type:complete len:1255 (-),score=211.77 TRINITY_DN14290_c0_g1_i1:59-3427(-)